MKYKDIPFLLRGKWGGVEEKQEYFQREMLPGAFRNRVITSVPSAWDAYLEGTIYIEEKG